MFNINPTQLIAPFLMLCVLGAVVLFDYLLRIQIYKRADPFSFSLLLYSLVLVVTDLGVKLVQASRGKIEAVFFLITASYIVIDIMVFFVVKLAHEKFVAAQEHVVIQYLNGLKKESNVAEGVWQALKTLGRDMIQPDAFRTSGFKRDKRIEFLELVRELTNAQIEPSEVQSQLLVNEKGVKYRARAAYITAICFGILGTLVLLLLRLT